MKKIEYWHIFIEMFKISAFTFGGGYVVIPMVEKAFVDKYHYFSKEELIDMATIAQSSPGAIAINLSALSGYRIANVKGVVFACIGSILPPMILLSIISNFYDVFIANEVIAAILHGMEAGVLVLLVDVLITMSASLIKGKDYFLYAMLVVSFIASFIFQINAFLILVVAILICIIYVIVRGVK